MNVHLVLLIAYSVALIGVGLWVARLVKGSSDFFVAGRQLSATLIFSTVLASNIGAGTTVGAAGVSYRDGISGWWWNGAAALGTLVLALWIGPRLWRVAAKYNLYTAGDYLELRYGPSVRGVIAALIWVGTLSILAGQLLAGAAVLRVVAGLSDAGGIIISAAVMAVYFVAGGLLSSAWVNAVQLVVLLTGFVIAVPIVVAKAGGLAAITSHASLPPTFNDLWYSAGPSSGWTFIVLLAPAFVISPGLIQKTYGAVSDRAVRVGIGAAAFVQAIFAFAPTLLGMSARVLTPDIGSPNLVLPTVLLEQLPTALGALGLAAIFSAEVSTCDAILFMLSTSLSKDLYKRFVAPEASDRDVLRVARLAAVAGAIGGVLFALQLRTVVDALAIFYSLLGVSLFVPVIGGLFVARAGTMHALAAIAAGVLTRLTLQYVTGVPPYPWADPTLLGLLAAAAAFFIALVIRPKDVVSI
jgi:solute:Na+ symporter, SSS family